MEKLVTIKFRKDYQQSIAQIIYQKELIRSMGFRIHINGVIKIESSNCPEISSTSNFRTVIYIQGFNRARDSFQIPIDKSKIIRIFNDINCIDNAIIIIPLSNG